MSTTVQAILQEHPHNSVRNENNHTSTKKAWATKFPVIRNLRPREGQDSFDEVFHSEDNDDLVRLGRPCFPLNDRSWILDTEADGRAFFNAEVVSPVLAAFTNAPLITQSEESSPVSSALIDTRFRIEWNNNTYDAAIGEYKRNIIVPDEWIDGHLHDANQKKLSQELRG